MTIALFLVAAFLSVGCAMGWHRFKLLHLGPFGLSFVVVAIGKWSGDASFDFWEGVLVLGVLLYFLGRLGSKQTVAGGKS